MAKFTWKLLLFAALALAAQVILSLDYARNPRKPSDGAAAVAPDGAPALFPSLTLPGGWTASLPPADTYRPDSAILLFQSYMRPDPKVGFLFKENLGQGAPVRLQWADQEPGEIHSDAAGFINSPYAIAARKEGRPVDIVGVGSSFMQGAAEKFHDFFWAKGMFYYSMATPRHTLQQFTAVVEDHAVKVRPKWIVYDLNEASFELLRDFDEWSRTGEDWFAYHSGTWCGPPRKGAEGLLADHPVLASLYAAVRRRVHPPRPIPPAPDAELVGRALEEITKARDAAEAAGIGFVVMTIPSRDLAVYGKSARWHRVEALLPLLRRAGVRVLDLKGEFMAEDDPRALYFQVDAHWNGYGMFKAANALSRALAAYAAAPADTGAPATSGNPADSGTGAVAHEAAGGTP